MDRDHRVNLLTVATGSERAQEQVRFPFMGLHVGDVMSDDPIALPIDLLAVDAAAYFSGHRHVAFPVTDPVGWPVGLLSLDRLEHVTDERLTEVSVAEFADTDPGLIAAEDDDVAELLARPAFRRVGRAAVVGPTGRLIGVVSVTDLERTIRARPLSAPSDQPPDLIPHQ